MTYCLALQTRDGLVFASDSRTTAGVDFVSTYRKLHVFQPAPDRFLVLLTSGSLATSQELLDNLNRDLDRPEVPESLRTVSYLFEAAQYLGRLLTRIQASHATYLNATGANAQATVIIGGQIAGKPAGLYMVYPEGNYIAASPETPFLQLGEFKYGKPVLSRLATEQLSLDDAARLAIVSLDATMKSNISVGPPVEVAIYRNGMLRLEQHLVMDEHSPLFREMMQRWNDGMRLAFDRMPRFDWEGK
jgi:putative proteasome-type protease